jgi:phospholipase/carboxylesterase
MSFRINSGHTSSSLVVFLHGYGSDAEDLKFLALHWKIIFPYLDFLGLDAPNKLQGGGYAWFDLMNDEWQTDILKAANYVETILNKETKPIILVGFSLGGFLATHMALYSSINIKACISFSGGILPQSTMEAKPRHLILIHGEKDEIILPNWHEPSCTFAKSLGASVISKMLPDLSHTIDQNALDFATEELAKILKSSSNHYII